MMTLEHLGIEFISRWRNNLERKQAEKEADRARQEFLDMISAAKEELRTARDNFNAITDETLLEYYIYEIKAAETKLNYYLNLAKKENLSCNTYLVNLSDGYQARGSVTI